jgi:hypothetical protein
MLAGFFAVADDDRFSDGKDVHGSAWEKVAACGTARLP